MLYKTKNNVTYEIKKLKKRVADIDKKLAALNAHISQTAHNPNLEQMIREFGERNAKLNGLADGAVAEIFKIVSSD